MTIRGDIEQSWGWIAGAAHVQGLQHQNHQRMGESAAWKS